MDETRARIIDDLRGILAGDLSFEPIRRSPYARDGSLFEVDPLGVVAPRTHEDLAALVRYAGTERIPIHARGAGTNPFGTAIGRGLVVDFGIHLRRILAIGESSVTVQPGAVLDEVNARLAPLGRRIWPDPSGSWSRTIGGMIGVGARGPRSIQYGPISESLERARVVFSNGEAGVLAPGAIPGDEPAKPDEPFDRALLRRLATLVNWHSPRMGRGSGATDEVDPLVAIRGDGRLLPHRALDGSLGALALMTEVTLRTGPVPSGQRVVIFPFSRLSEAASAIPDCLLEGPSRCELVDWRALRLAREHDPFWSNSVPARAEAALIVEFLGDDPAVPASRARSLVHRLSRNPSRLNPVIEMGRGSDCDRALGLRTKVEPRLMTMKGRARPTALVPALEAPPEAWARLIVRLQNVFKSHDVNWTLHGCVGSGEIRVRPFLDLGHPSDRDRLGPLADAIVESAIAEGGRPHRESGRGIVSPRLLGPEGGTPAASSPLKFLFDPIGGLNPGVLGNDRLDAVPRSIRAPAPPSPPGLPDPLPVIEPRLRWGELGPAERAMDCNGCGGCRSFDPALRICPSFRASRREDQSPRAMAGLIRDLANGRLDRSTWGGESIRRIADHCVHCRLCESECPSGVDVSSMMLEVKAAYAEQHGLSPSEWFMSRIETWARLAVRVPGVYNRLIASRSARVMLERLIGLSKDRSLPRAGRSPFVRLAEKVGLSEPAGDRPGPRVVYFLDFVANYFDQAVAEGVVAVLRHCGVQVYVPKLQRGSGMPALVAGDLDSAREVALANLRILGSAVREGHTVVCSEPTAALMLRSEYLKLTDDLDAELVAANTMDVGHYLQGLRSRGLLPRPQLPIHARVGYHLPCHLRALGVGIPAVDLLRQVPELEVEHIDRGCSGMAGTYGMSRGHFRPSLRAGRGLRNRLRDPDIEIASAECSACRMQMEQGNRKRSYHPISLLAMSYGLLPGQLRSLREPRDRRFALG
ncbi:FAD-binding and (Fe-S)-binding domain-containing protein [Tautonia plasticadhaerens]|uniref:FAD-binding and (Fe-S)-binding domain-containing protein n=1 Tax=Tautonia plasticadhaerens TaxID=2527974 RepID=UPI00119FAD9B|nr:FAD-binding and (Fe-S)-binding domain-containing protein [Tautonia plasticadhaerens]